MTSKALFLDRDGVVNEDHGYVSTPDQFSFIDGIFAACQRFQQQGYRIIIITNQSGIGRGYYSEADFQQLTEWMKRRFKENGVTIDGVYFCPHHPEKALAPYLKHCDCRKPKPGMLLQAINDFHLDPAQCVMVGDKPSDMEAAERAGIGKRVLVLSGQTDKEATPANALKVIDSIADLQP
ncbi:D-glycero-beta-D-manno-heptose-1,7-bisphosphate 7-phosphatase [Idiomarina tyrosinivorans]|uniref:D,D-heptose 1,7-bisphosphate phosphatase n=1 Tax=Idiomarina tyrosinivorans TaxID=1445662 RepID=A0A432ZJI3_9GAMM|nr:D-glycero-beta-D-manno-heptose 1,7-bisphosphate 7-phosphatase [Idiomarina tyrosinivorans]RUO78185.1 D-glycero-beta-D-manno-heptose-1,7-bisphosphate 7-phosphatase [Idiomarina tyrosinivorans]